MKTGVCTDAGKVREINQDDYAIYENGCRLYIVADGMGGHQCGEIASRMAVEVIVEHVKKYMSPDMDGLSVKGILFEAYHRANKKILEYNQIEPACSGMGTTLTLLYHCQKHSLIGHIGDSRAYVLHNRQLDQVTEDHSLVAELCKNGEISKEEAKKHPQRHVITRALGMSDYSKADIFSIELHNNDKVLLCTDGLTNLVSDEEINDIMNRSSSEEELAHKMVQLAIERGGHDNITVVIVNIERILEESR